MDTEAIKEADCTAGDCRIHCNKHGCYCWASADDPSDCNCDCSWLKPMNKSGDLILKGGKIKKFRHKMEVTPRAKYNIRIRNVPITQLALTFDKMLPNSIVIPAIVVTKIVTLSLKNKTLTQIIIASGLAFKR